MSSQSVSLCNEDIIFWAPHNPQGDLFGTSLDINMILGLTKQVRGRASLLIDLSASEMPNLAQKKEIAKAGKKYKFKKVAVYGFTWRLKLVIDFIVKLIGNVNVQLFESRAKALEWLKDKEI